MTLPPPASTPPEIQWLQMILSVTTSAMQVVETLKRADVIYSANDLATLIAAATPGAAVGSALMTKEQAEAYAAMIDSLSTFINTPVGTGQLTPLQILYKTWPAPPPPA